MTEQNHVLPDSSSQPELLLELQRLERLINAAAHNQPIESYGEDSNLYVDVNTHHILDVNHATLDLLGFSKADLVGMPITQLEHTVSDDAAVPRFIRNSIDEYMYESLYRHHLGHSVSVKVTRRLIQKDGRDVIHYRLEDNSLHHRTWHELQRREDIGFTFQEKLKALNEITLVLSHAESVDALCWQAIKLAKERLDFDRLSIWFVDLEHEQMTGSYGVDEAGDIRPEHDQRWSYADTAISEYLQGKNNSPFAYREAPLYNEKSQIIDYGWHISAPMTHGAQFIGILTADNYLRRQQMKSYEPDLLRLYGSTIGHLIELVRARDRAFSARLQQAHTDMLRQFIADVGHDFRTPLSVINTHGFLLERTLESEKRHSLASGIQTQVMYLSKMLTDMLEFIRLDGRVEMEFIPTDLGDLVREAAYAQHPRSTAKNIQFQLALENPPTLEVDPRYLKRALSSVIENAIQYTPEGGSMRVDFVHYADKIGVRVRDTGIGIESTALQNLFKPLYRVDQARTQRGSGLGLSIAKAIINLHQGDIMVESAPGQGSTFEIVLPLSNKHNERA